MQVSSVNNVPAIDKQSFKSAKFFKVPVEVEDMFLKNSAFSELAKEYDIFISASPKRTWRDPFGFRIPKPDEKCYLSCKMFRPEDSFDRRIIETMTDGKFVAPLKEHANTLLKRVSEIYLENTLRKWL